MAHANRGCPGGGSIFVKIGGVGAWSVATPDTRAAMETPVSKERLAELHCFTAIILLLLAAGRLIYIALCATPLRPDIDPLLQDIPIFLFGAYFTFIRFHLILALLLNGVALVGVSFTGSFMASVLLVYSGRHLPMTDSILAAADRLVGFDWPSVLKLFDRYPQMDWLLHLAYNSIFPQIFLVLFALALTQQAERTYRFIVAMNLALLLTFVIGVFFPALGPYEFFGLSAADHPNISLVTEAKTTAPIAWLRQATFDTPMPVPEVGLIWFPSFHAAAAAIYVWAVWRTPAIKLVGLGLNALMMIATPVHGSHYVVDLFAGLAVALVSIAVAIWMFGLLRLRRQPIWSAAGSPA